ncbi:MAG TPA: amino acid adenylation domain-containing protein, partial [Thermoanaerobaculia bacterium]
MARFLVAGGVGPEAIVGILLDRSLELIVALLGVLKAGGAYLPLDPSLPPQRLAGMVADCGAAVIVTRGEVVPGVWDEAAVVDWGRDGEVLRRGPGERGVVVDPMHLAYVLYTSGSTGRPKGVMVTHRGIVNHMLWMDAAFPLGAEDAVVQKTPFGFDASVWEFYAPLIAGSRLVVASPGGHKDPSYLLSLVARQRAGTLQAVPSLLRLLLEEPGLESCGLQRLFCGGEPLPVSLRDELWRRLEVPLINLYGPTETTVQVTSWICAPGSARGAVPIGRPIANVHLYVVDRSARPLPPGVAGELWIGGVAVGRGYLGRPELTAERFVPDPFAVEAGVRVYRTGDLVRWLADGAVDFLSRLDHQVKIRGLRIEPGEIEAVLGAHPRVRQAVVVVHGDTAGDQRLAAYVVARKEDAPEARDLRDHLKRHLPDYMVPASFVVVETLPRTHSGKLDRTALLALQEPLRGEDGHFAPRSPVEEILVGLWEEVLGRERVGAHDDFFALGGHSLLATRVLSRVREACAVELPLRSLFESPTPERLAAVICAARPAGRPAPPLAPAARRGDDLPLSFAQQRLWFLAQLEPDSPAYNVPLAVCLRGPLDAPALAAALRAVERRHEALRTVFGLNGEEPVQRPGSAPLLALPAVDLAGLCEPARHRESARLAREEALRPFDLATGPVWRAALLRLGGDEHVALITLHHIVSDAWSGTILLREISELYGSAVRREVATLPPLPVQYADFAVWQRDWLQGDVLREQLDFWRQWLAGAPRVL